MNPGAKSRIDFFEDPLPYDLVAWQEARKFCSLAIDWELNKVNWLQSEPLPFDILVYKPARDDEKKMIERAQSRNLKVMVTSSLEHPLGVVHSLAVATDLKERYPKMIVDPGCLSFHAYQPDDFSRLIQTQGPYLISPSGAGVGFDIQLKSLKWEKIPPPL